MAAGVPQLYDNGIKVAIGDGDWSVDDHCVVLLTSGYTPSAAHATYSDISAFACTDADYAPQNMTGETDAAAGGVQTFDAADTSFGDPVTITAKYAVIVMGTVAALAAGSQLVAYIDLDTGGGSVSSSAGAFSINWNASGIATATQV